MPYAMIARDRPHGLEQRIALRADHFNYLHSLVDKAAFAGAPFGDADKMDLIDGSGNSFLEEAKTLMSDDPFVVRGVYGSYEVKCWN